jgi:hypothetical protein
MKVNRRRHRRRGIEGEGEKEGSRRKGGDSKEKEMISNKERQKKLFRNVEENKRKGEKAASNKKIEKEKIMRMGERWQHTVIMRNTDNFSESLSQ